MSWRTVVVTGNAKIEYKLDYLVVRKFDEVKRVHISEIGTLLVDSTAVSITSSIMCELIKNKVKVIFCDEKHNPLYELYSYYGSHDCSLKIKQQVSWMDHTKQMVWTEIIKDKIYKQSEHLRSMDYITQANLLLQYIDEIEQGDITNREGHAAKVYFNALFGKDFSRNDDNSINAALDYGYSLLLSNFNKEVVSCGYITQLGLWHTNQFNHFNLSSDLMESFRILVDRKVISMNINRFDWKEKLTMLDVLNQNVMIEGQNQTVSNAIKIYCKSVFNSLNENDASLIKRYTNVI